jgi:hypothetical protein
MKTTTFSIGILLAVTACGTWADVASRVQESNSTTHEGVLAYVRDASPQGRKTERSLLGEDLRKVSAAAPGFLIQIVGPEEIPGGALPGSVVILTPSGDKVVAARPGPITTADLRSLVASASVALQSDSVAAVPYFEYDH